MACSHLLCSLRSDGGCDQGLSVDNGQDDEPDDALPVDIVLQWRAFKARKSLAEFVKQAWRETDSGVPLKWNWHHQALCDHLQRMLLDWIDQRFAKQPNLTIQRLLVNIPPGTAKSRIASVFFPSWAWLHAPSWRVLCVSMNPKVAARDAIVCRNLIESDWYQSTFRPEWGPSKDSDSRDWFLNTAGGERRSFGYTGSVTGLRSDCVSGSMLVATEIGDIPIAELVKMASLPRVWSQAMDGRLELRKVLASRAIAGKNTVGVVTKSGNVLRCTDDHRIYTQGEYVTASGITGRQVSVLQGGVKKRKQRTSQMPVMCDGDFGVCPVFGCLSESRGGIRQEGATRADRGAVLLKEMQDAAEQSTGSLEAVQTLRQAFSPQVKQGHQAVLFQGVCVFSTVGQENAAGRPLRVVRGDDGSEQCEAALLHDGMQECGTLCTYARGRQFTFQGSDREGRSVFSDDAAYQGARSQDMCGMWCAGVKQATSRASRGSQPGEQPARELDYPLPCVSHGTPQTQDSTVLSVERTSVSGVEVTDTVYDIQVEGNHNFFANGILVHNCVLVDDPNDPHEAYSETMRASVNDTWDIVLSNRLNDLAVGLFIGIQQRVHEDDWSAHVLKSGQWEHLRLPLLYELVPGCKCVTCKRGHTLYGWRDPRTEDGEVLHSARFSERVIAVEQSKGSVYFAGQFQQRPAPADGEVFRLSWFKWFDLENMPALDDVLISCDLANTSHASKTNSNNALLVMGRKGPWRYVLDMELGRWTLTDVMQRIAALQALWHERTQRLVKILVEKKATGPSVIDALKIDLKLQCVVEDDLAMRARDDKLTRAMAIQPQVEGGNVMLPKGAPWVDGFVHELTVFKGIGDLRDDQVDAFTMALNYWRGSTAAARADWR